MARRPRSTTASTAGHGGASGSSCWMRWSMPPWSRAAPRSTAPTSRPNARRSEEKGACDAGDRPLARRLDDQSPRAHRRHRPSLCADADPGNVSDVKAAPALLERAGRMRYLLGDKGYDADRLRRSLREVGVTPVIPGRRNRKLAANFLSGVALATAIAFWL